MRVRLFLLAAVFSFPVRAQHSFRSYWNDATSYREHELDITHLKLDVSFDPAKGLVKGRVAHSFRVLRPSVDSVFFDGPAIKINAAALNGKSLAYRSTAEGVWIYPSRSLHWEEAGIISFDYTATPKRGIYFVGWNVPENKELNPFAIRRQIWTQGQGIDNRHWIPMYDNMNDKFTTETIVHFPAGYQVLSNGSLLEQSTESTGMLRWHYKMTHPHAGYLLMLGIGDYAIDRRKSKSGVPLNLYYYPQFADRMKPTYRYSAELVDFMEQETGIAYPWESYSQIMVQEFLYGAMENTTATIFGDFFNVDERAYGDRNYVGVNCHELTHQWFGDYITARDGRDAWLQESFATYYPKLFTRKQFGEDEYDWQRWSDYNTALDAGKRDSYPIRHSSGGTARVYQKGSSVISMLAYVLGDDAWKKALKAYVQQHAYANVESNDILQSIQDQLGQDMSWFFDQWVYRGGEPEYTVSWESLHSSRKGAYTAVSVKQTHKRDEVTGLFSMPVVVEVHYTDGTHSRVKEWIKDEAQQLTVPNPGNKQPAFVLFDPNARILKSMVFKRSFAELKAQVLHAPHMLDRYEALLALKSTGIEQKRALLLNILRGDDFYRIKAEAAAQLAKDAASESTIIAASHLAHPVLQMAALRAMNPMSNPVKRRLERALNDSSYDVVQLALETLCRNYPAEAGRFIDAVEGVIGMNNSVAIKKLEMSALYTNDLKEQALSRLVYLASAAWEFRTRNNAFTALKNLGYCDTVLIRNLFDAALSRNGRLAAPAVQTAETLAQQTKYRDMMVQCFKQASFSKADKEALKVQFKFLPL